MQDSGNKVGIVSLNVTSFAATGNIFADTIFASATNASELFRDLFLPLQMFRALENRGTF